MVNTNITFKPTTQTQEEFNVTYIENGYGAVVPVINDVRREDMIAGCVSEADAEAYIELVKKALKATNGDIAKAKIYMMKAVRNADRVQQREKEDALEIVFVDGLMCQIDYNKKKIYSKGLEIANLDNITVPLSRKGIKEVLMDKVYYMRCH